MPTGTLTIQLETNPTAGFKEINLGINKVQVHLSANAAVDAVGWQDVPMPKLINENFLNFTDTALILAKGVVPTGNYKSIKLAFDKSDGASLPNYVIIKGESQDDKFFSVEVAATQSELLVVNTDIEVKKSENALMGITLNLRALAKYYFPFSTSAAYIFYPIATALDLSKAGSIEINLGTTDGTVMVSVQRNGKIIRNKIPASPGIVKLTHLPLSTSDLDKYQVVFSSPNFVSMVIYYFPVISSDKPTQFLALKQAVTLAPSVNTIKTPIRLFDGWLYFPEAPAFEVLIKTAYDNWIVVDYGYSVREIAFISAISTTWQETMYQLFSTDINGGGSTNSIKVRANPDVGIIKEQNGVPGQPIGIYR